MRSKSLILKIFLLAILLPAGSILIFHPAFIRADIVNPCSSSSSNSPISVQFSSNGLLTINSSDPSLLKNFFSSGGNCLVGGSTSNTKNQAYISPSQQFKDYQDSLKVYFCKPQGIKPSQFLTINGTSSDPATQISGVLNPPAPTPTPTTNMAFNVTGDQNTCNSDTPDNPATPGNFDTNNLNFGSFSKGTIIFVDGNLTIDKDLTYATTANQGLVFIVNGAINITPSVRTINAVLITFGDFCSNYDPTKSPPWPSPCSSSGGDNQLTINGSVISLNYNKPPKFVRDLGSGNVASPAEQVNYEPKYLVIFKDLLSSDQSYWSEIQ